MDELVEAIRRNPEDGARRLVAQCRDRLYAVAWRLCGNAADAEDLVYRTILRGVERIGSYRGESSLFAWLDAILVNFYHMSVRPKGIRALVPVEEVPEEEADAPSAADMLARGEDASVVRAAVAALLPVFREVTVLRYFEDMSVTSIAAVLNIPEGSVKSRLSRAKLRLRRILAGTFCEKKASNSMPDEKSRSEKP